MFEPAVKWSGSKRSQADSILENFPKEINTYYEPFCGGCSVLRKLLSSDIHVKQYICSDINADLINLWQCIKYNPKIVIEHYTKLWNELNIDSDKERKKKYFESVRARYNVEHSALDFMFIMRTTTNGMPRYNMKGEFNNSFHITRNGITPKKLEVILNDWSSVLNANNVVFRCCDYTSIKSSVGDMLYLDPPYAGTKGMYTGGLKLPPFFDWLRSQDAPYLLSFDGISGDEDNTYAVPFDVYSRHVYLKSGNSSFKRTIGKSSDSIVFESLYIK